MADLSGNYKISKKVWLSLKLRKMVLSRCWVKSLRCRDERLAKDSERRTGRAEPRLKKRTVLLGPCAARRRGELEA